jgi:hypothetical protein
MPVVVDHDPSAGSKLPSDHFQRKKHWLEKINIDVREVNWQAGDVFRRILHPTRMEVNSVEPGEQRPDRSDARIAEIARPMVCIVSDANVSSRVPGKRIETVKLYRLEAECRSGVQDELARPSAKYADLDAVESRAVLDAASKIVQCLIYGIQAVVRQKRSAARDRRGGERPETR